jgi:hypothetical protein
VAAHEREVPLPPPTLKLAEVQLADASEYTRMYVVRHRMIIRVVRSAAAAAALALLAMAIHEWVANLAATPRRYGPAAFTAVAVMLALFVAADVSEHESVSKRVFELTKYRHAEAVLGRACPPAR